MDSLILVVHRKMIWRNIFQWLKKQNSISRKINWFSYPRLCEKMLLALLKTSHIFAISFAWNNFKPFDFVKWEILIFSWNRLLLQFCFPILILCLWDIVQILNFTGNCRNFFYVKSVHTSDRFWFLNFTWKHLLFTAWILREFSYAFLAIISWK